MTRQDLMVLFTVIVAVVLILDGFFNIGFIDTAASEIQSWGVIIAALALGLAFVNLSRVHIRRISLRRANWQYSVALVMIMFVQAIIGFIDTSSGDIYNFGFEFVLTPAGAMMYALLALWIASAAYRAFTARSIDSAILLISATLVMLGNAPIGQAIYQEMPSFKDWIMDVPNMAAQRGIMIGASIGAIALGIRILMGIERGHLGGGE
ncbi:MAG: hypothetical protein ACLFPS_09360 [Clostridia bacterium]